MPIRFPLLALLALLTLPVLAAPAAVASPAELRAEDILRAADTLFTRQGIEQLEAKLVVYRDPANRIPLADLRSDRVNAPGLIPLHGRYEFWAPDHYNFYLLGFLLASSEVDPGLSQGLTSPLLPLPGGILALPSVQERFHIRLSNPQLFDEDGEPAECHVIRLHPRKPEGEFFKSLTYYITVEEPHLVRGVRATFSDGGSWNGTGWGTFYYRTDRQGRLLPFVGVGQINFRNPDRRVILKGKWRDFKVNQQAEVNPDAIREAAPTAPIDREAAI